MTLDEVIRKRRSVRKYSDKSLTEEEIKALAEAALMAPSAVNYRPVELIVVTDPEKIKQLAGFKTHYAQFIDQAPAAFIVIGDTRKLERTIVQDTSIVTTQLMLKATDLGLGSCWVNVVGGEHEDGRPADEVLREWFDIPEHYFINAVVPIGHLDYEPRPRVYDDLEEKIHRDKF